MHVDPNFSLDDPATGKDQFNRTKRGIASEPAVGDLDGDGKLEIVAAALDRHVYAWHADGTPVAGFPVLVVDPAKVAAVDPVTHKVTFKPDSGVGEGGELLATPTLADLNGDGRPEIVVGAQEEYAEPVNIGVGRRRARAARVGGHVSGTRACTRSRPTAPTPTYPDTSAAHPDEQAYLPGWPATLGHARSSSRCRPSATASRLRPPSATSTRRPGPK